MHIYRYRGISGDTRPHRPRATQQPPRPPIGLHGHLLPDSAAHGRRSRRRNRPSSATPAPAQPRQNSTGRGQIGSVSGRHRPTNSNKQQPATPRNHQESPGRTGSADETRRSQVAAKDAIDPQLGWGRFVARPFCSVSANSKLAVQRNIRCGGSDCITHGRRFSRTYRTSTGRRGVTGGASSSSRPSSPWPEFQYPDSTEPGNITLRMRGDSEARISSSRIPPASRRVKWWFGQTSGFRPRRTRAGLPHRLQRRSPDASPRPSLRPCRRMGMGQRPGPHRGGTPSRSSRTLHRANTGHLAPASSADTPLASDRAVLGRLRACTLIHRRKGRMEAGPLASTTLSPPSWSGHSTPASRMS